MRLFCLRSDRLNPEAFGGWSVKSFSGVFGRMDVFTVCNRWQIVRTPHRFKTLYQVFTLPRFQCDIPDALLCIWTLERGHRSQKYSVCPACSGSYHILWGRHIIMHLFWHSLRGLYHRLQLGNLRFIMEHGLQIYYALVVPSVNLHMHAVAHDRSIPVRLEANVAEWENMLMVRYTTLAIDGPCWLHYIYYTTA